jgi:MFS family permease
MAVNPLRDRRYRRLFSAQVLSLVGTGAGTVALGLLAFELAGADAGLVLGIAFALKMVAYVFIAPVAAGLFSRTGRKEVMVGLDLARAVVVVSIPFVTEVWQVYFLVFVLSSLSAGFTPTFQAVIPEILEDEPTYTRALSLSRIAYELENLGSPLIAALFLVFTGFDALFALNGLTFLVSAALITRTAIPKGKVEDLPSRDWKQTTAGLRLFRSNPALRGIAALNAAVALAGAMVIVNTVVFVKDALGGGNVEMSLTLAAGGAGATVAAILVPRLLDAIPERRVLIGGACLLPVGLGLGYLVGGVIQLAAAWAVIGVGLSLVQTPIGRLLARIATPEERPSLFAAQFSVSHAAWLVAYPLAGAIGIALGVAGASLVLAGLATLTVIIATLLWRPEGDASGSRPR